VCFISGATECTLQSLIRWLARLIGWSENVVLCKPAVGAERLALERIGLSFSSVAWLITRKDGRLTSANPRQPPDLQVSPGDIAWQRWPDLLHSSYVVDPEWQRKFTIIWCSVVGVVAVASLPKLARSLRNGHSLKGFFGISEDLQKGGYISVACQDKLPSPLSNNRFTWIWCSITSVRYWTLPYINLAQSWLYFSQKRLSTWAWVFSLYYSCISRCHFTLHHKGCPSDIQS